ncbi:MAG: MATE family efflux transporter, partial [Clostridia bacterium]|nr:MATE family efflux transporter [Clostridia bacterium]
IIWCVIRIIYILIVMKLFGDISYIYWAYPITWGMSTIVFALYYKFSHWERGFGAKADLINNDN